jgi:predicted nucleic acid-binding protein
MGEAERGLVFLDTASIPALVNTRDQWHDAAVCGERLLAREHRRLLTTEFVVAEIADGLAAVRFRAHAGQAIAALQSSPFVEIIAASSTLFLAARELDRARPDKDWGLSDGASLVVMTERPLVEARTPDDYFRQASFRALLLEEPKAEGT